MKCYGLGLGLDTFRWARGRRAGGARARAAGRALRRRRVRPGRPSHPFLALTASTVPVITPAMRPCLPAPPPQAGRPRRQLPEARGQRRAGGLPGVSRGCFLGMPSRAAPALARAAAPPPPRSSSVWALPVPALKDASHTCDPLQPPNPPSLPPPTPQRAPPRAAAGLRRHPDRPEQHRHDAHARGGGWGGEGRGAGEGEGAGGRPSSVRAAST
jgi:hypothetical protein